MNIEKVTEVHPMRQIFWESIIQLVVVAFMLGSMVIIGHIV